jgi:hypothetical protein
MGCPFWGETVCPIYVLQPRKGCPIAEVESRMVGTEKYRLVYEA